MGSIPGSGSRARVETLGISGKRDFKTKITRKKSLNRSFHVVRAPKEGTLILLKLPFQASRFSVFGPIEFRV